MNNTTTGRRLNVLLIYSSVQLNDNPMHLIFKACTNWGFIPAKYNKTIVKQGKKFAGENCFGKYKPIMALSWILVNNQVNYGK